MFEVYLISVFSLLLSEYGFQTRKNAMERFGAPFQWGRTIERFVIWGAIFALWFVKVTRGWRGFLIVAVGGFVMGEITAYILRRSIRNDIRNRYPLSRPLTHFLPFAAGIFPSILMGIVFYWIFQQPLWMMAPFPIVALKFMTGFIALFCWGTFVTVSLIGLVRADQISDQIEPRLNAGEVIGILERVFSFTLVLSGGLAAIGFAVAAKAAARYPQFKDSAFAEYFLIGTLSSVGLAIIIALLVSIS